MAIPRRGAVALAGDAGSVEVDRSCGRRAPRGDGRNIFPGFPPRVQWPSNKEALLTPYETFLGSIKVDIDLKWLEEYLLCHL